jgi:hypothetical protein
MCRVLPHWEAQGETFASKGSRVRSGCQREVT